MKALEIERKREHDNSRVNKRGQRQAVSGRQIDLSTLFEQFRMMFEIWDRNPFLKMNELFNWLRGSSEDSR